MSRCDFIGQYGMRESCTMCGVARKNTPAICFGFRLAYWAKRAWIRQQLTEADLHVGGATMFGWHADASKLYKKLIRSERVTAPPVLRLLELVRLGPDAVVVELVRLRLLETA